MPRAKFQTLTEQMFYVLLCLESERWGTEIMDLVPAMTQGRVRIGSGTLYHLLEQFLQAGMISLTRETGRRRCYLLTPKGRETLEAEYQRLCALAADYERILGKEANP
ncbi:MAG: helix-turn-helix transcriptional regulator [Evtepia sp.]|uniref:PadR family transcriptional regulator n=1 Tax=Evtepia sp. TaxID=2773933 RepID=UPI002A764BDF|nr:helix-turn-helix transcriptional regulator [Evtepia sp.]MDY3013672.1 helix-turn-helix transcriptional regulator [Evtepia sp.]